MSRKLSLKMNQLQMKGWNAYEYEYNSIDPIPSIQLIAFKYLSQSVSVCGSLSHYYSHWKTSPLAKRHQLSLLFTSLAVLTSLTFITR